MIDSPAAPTVATPGPAPSGFLDSLAVLRVSGADARAFLDAQLTRNVPDAGSSGEPGVASLAGYCSPKGRLLATFVTWSDADGVSLVLSRDLAASIAKRLRMYVLRAKVTIDEAPDARLAGVEGRTLPTGEALDPWQVAVAGARTFVRFPDADGRPRLLRLASGTDAPDAPIDDAAWRWRDIRAGLPWVTAATQDRFVPQMLNLEAIGAVDFRKGCFPGQEVVARSQYLGKLKRRTALGVLASHDAAPAAGSDVWQAAGSEAVGVVVAAERGPDGRVALLAELPLALFDAPDLHVGTPDGPALTVEPLPYALPDNEVFVRPRL